MKRVLVVAAALLVTACTNGTDVESEAALSADDLSTEVGSAIEAAADGEAAPEGDAVEGSGVEGAQLVVATVPDGETGTATPAEGDDSDDTDAAAGGESPAPAAPADEADAATPTTRTAIQVNTDTPSAPAAAATPAAGATPTTAADDTDPLSKQLTGTQRTTLPKQVTTTTQRASSNNTTVAPTTTQAGVTTQRPVTTQQATTTTQRATTTTQQATTTTQRATTTTQRVTTTTSGTVPPDAGDVRPPTVAGDYLETFESSNSMSTLDFYVVNGRAFGNEVTSWPGDHASGGLCGGPFTSRTINWPSPPGNDTPTRHTSAGETAYWCAPGGTGSGHMMTSFHTKGYAHLDFSPKRTFNDVTWVCYDVNPTNLGNRKWNQVVIASTSVSNSVAPRLDWTHPHFRGNGPASWGLPVTNGVFMFMSTQGGSEVMTGGGASAKGNSRDLSVSDPKKRVTTCLHDKGNGQIDVIQERWNGTVDVTTLPGEFPSGQVRVVFQDTSYNPDKAHTESAPKYDGYTWHWDNLYVSSQ